jgi:CRP-like cAMP-binding protein
MKDLLALLNNIHPLSDALQQYLAEKIKTRQVTRKETILQAGHLSRHIYFIQKGLLRSFYYEDDHEISSAFMLEGDMLVSVQSFFYQAVSIESIQAIEESRLSYICYDELQFIFKQFKEANYIGRILMTRNNIVSEQRLHCMRMKKAAARYQFMLKYYPQLILRVPAKYMATYLGISEETLSRIRSRKY